MASIIVLEDMLREEKLERAKQRICLRDDLFIGKQIPDSEFVSNYRLSRGLFEALCEEIIPLLPPKKNTRAIDPVTKILTALSFYARGSYQGVVGLNIDGPMAQQTVSKCLKQVTEALNHPRILMHHIKYPQNRQERNLVKEKFYNKYNIPGICGCIDCTHISIVRPKLREERYFNRKHFHSINCQVICDSEHRILNVDASYGGATHDSFVWQNSEIREHLEQLTSTSNETAMLLGDSGYPLRKYLMTPVDGAQDETPEGRYNSKHKKVRSTIERTFGILKGRWRCLLAARQLHYEPEMAGKITIACCVLHNMCVNGNLDDITLSHQEEVAEAQLQNRPAISGTHELTMLEQGHMARRDLIQLLDRNLR